MQRTTFRSIWIIIMAERKVKKNSLVISSFDSGSGNALNLNKFFYCQEKNFFFKYKSEDADTRWHWPTNTYVGNDLSLYIYISLHYLNPKGCCKPAWTSSYFFVNDFQVVIICLYIVVLFIHLIFIFDILLILIFFLYNNNNL